MYVYHLRNTVGARRMLVVLLSVALIGCSSVTHSNVANNNQPENNNTAMETDSNNQSSDAIDSRLVSANTKFGLKLYAEAAKQSAGKNIFLSPASVGLALAMTYNGAVG